MSQSARLAAVLLILLVLSPFAWAQDSSQESQSPPPGLPAVANPVSSETNSPSPLQPDTHPLAGAYLFTLGSSNEGHNYLQPKFSIGELGTTNPEYAPNAQKQLTLATLPEANFLLVHASRRNEFSVNYLGGAFIYNNHDTSLDSAFHSLNLSDQVQFRRLALTLSDVFSYLPQASFGFGGIGGLGGFGSGLYAGTGIGNLQGQVSPLFLPNQSVLTSPIGSYNNSALLQADYALTARTSFSLIGSYGTLQAGTPSSGFLNENDAMGSGGVQHSLNPRDTIGVSYYYTTFHYVGLPESFNANSVNFDYGRKITGRLALQLYGGPEFVSDHTGNSTQTRTLASGFGNLTYARGRNNFGLFGGRYATGGSGVLAGSVMETISGSWSRQVTRKWNASVYSGISRNSSLVQSTAVTTHYNYWYSSLSVNRTLGRYVSFYLNYSYQRQLTNAGPCTTKVCAVNLAEQIFGIGLIFTPRPIGL